MRVSDHALLRFLERAGGYDFDALRRAIAESLERAATAADRIGAVDMIVEADGLRYVICDGVIVTVLEGRTR